VKVLMVPLAALVLSGCTSPDYDTYDLALLNTPTPGAREALQQQPDAASCRSGTRHDTPKFADLTHISATAVAYVIEPGSARYAQLDDPTKDWTREQATGPSGPCPPTGRKHRYFA
jgi:hypothetical protein